MTAKKTVTTTSSASSTSRKATQTDTAGRPITVPAEHAVFGGRR